MLEKLLPTFIRTLPKFKGLTKKDSREHLLSGSAMYLSETGGVYYAHNGYYNLYLNCPNLNENFYEGTPSDILTVVSETKKNKTELSDEIGWAVEEGLLTPGSVRKHHAPLYTGDGLPEQISPLITSDIIALSEYIKLFVSKSGTRPNLQGVCIHGGNPEYIGFSATNGFGLVNFRSTRPPSDTTLSGERILRIEPFLALKKAKVDTVLECLLYPSNFIQITCLIGDMIVTLEYNACINERFPPVDTIALIEGQSGEYFEVDNRFLACINLQKRDFKGGYFSIPLLPPHNEDTYVLIHGGGDLPNGDVRTVLLVSPEHEYTPKFADGEARTRELAQQVNHVDANHSLMDSKVVGDMIRLIPKYFDIDGIRVGIMDSDGNIGNTFLRFHAYLEDYDVRIICAPSRVNVNYIFGELSNEEETEWRKVSL